MLAKQRSAGWDDAVSARDCSPESPFDAGGGNVADPVAKESGHRPVLCQQILDLVRHHVDTINPHRNVEVLDATYGRGGHTRALLQTFASLRVVALDRDPDAIAHAQETAQAFPGRFQAIHSTFSGMSGLFDPGRFDVVLFDFGVSSPQLDTPERGFSFLHDGPLDMRMDASQSLTAADIVNTWDEKALADLFFFYGQDRASRKIARAIVQDRAQKPFTRTCMLADLIVRLTPPAVRWKGCHPATRVFQALRIAVNQELDEIQRALPQAWNLVRPGGLILTIAFHSLEDRLCKVFFQTPRAFSCVAKKPLVPLDDEILVNPRARSSCLRYGLRLP